MDAAFLFQGRLHCKKVFLTAKTRHLHLVQVQARTPRLLNMDKTIEWLLQGEAWIEYRTRVELLEQPETDPPVSTARKKMLADLTELEQMVAATLAFGRDSSTAEPPGRPAIASSWCAASAPP